MNALVPIPDPSGIKLFSEADLRAHYKAVRVRMEAVDGWPDIAEIQQALDLAVWAHTVTHLAKVQAFESRKRLVMLRAKLEADKRDAACGGRIWVNEIQANTAREFGFNLNDLLSSSRTGDLVRARQTAMWLVRQITGHSLPEIGRRFGGRDHTTVLHALRRVEARRAGDAAFAERVDGLRGRIEERREVVKRAAHS